MPFGLGPAEIVILVILGGFVFFFGKDKIKDWLSIGKEIKEQAKGVRENEN